MKIEIFEKADLSSLVTDLDLMLDYTISMLKREGHTVLRYEKETDPEAFDRVKGYALPVILVDDEILCAGAYDFTLLERWKLNNSAQRQKGAGCETTSPHCQSCPNRGNCTKIREQ